MRKIIAVLVLATCALPIFAAASSCTTIKQTKQRLACYDKAALASSQKPLVPTAAPTILVPVEKMPEGVVFKSASWYVNQKLDAMTDKKNCTALYKNAWTIQGTPRSFYASFRGRGGVKGYKLRIDDAPADAMQLATAMEKSISAVDLEPSFERVYNSKRVRLEVLTILDNLLVEDVDMAGFKDAIDYIRANCET